MAESNLDKVPLMMDGRTCLAGLLAGLSPLGNLAGRRYTTRMSLIPDAVGGCKIAVRGA